MKSKHLKGRSVPPVTGPVSNGFASTKNFVIFQNPSKGHFSRDFVVFLFLDTFRIQGILLSDVWEFFPLYPVFLWERPKECCSLLNLHLLIIKSVLIWSIFVSCLQMIGKYSTKIWSPAVKFTSAVSSLTVPIPNIYTFHDKKIINGQGQICYINIKFEFSQKKF